MPRGRVKRTYEQFVESFWSKVVKTDHCWLWIGGRRGLYGCCYYKNKNWQAHRVSYSLFYGDFDKSLYVMHSCDNTMCVRPDHLSLGTCKDNLADAAAKGRMGVLKKDYCIRGHDYNDPKNVYSRQDAKYLFRYCNECRKLRRRKNFIDKEKTTAIV